ncbi:MAG: hypothetical protein KGL39_34665, partial [Patescibacteria group bacterium]|nr:hypothetical protein [Patescibacteria group bacterium]
MKKLLYILGGLVAGAILFGGSVVEAQVSSNYWKLLSGSIQPNIASWTLTLPYLPSKNCIGTDANGLLQAGTGCTGGSLSPFATTTSTVSGENVIYPLNNSDILTVGSSSTTTAPFYFDPNTRLLSINGKVGIGTSSPGAKFDVYGGTFRLSSSNSSYYTDFINQAVSNDAFQIQQHGHTVLKATSDASSGITLGNGGASLLVSPANSYSSFVGSLGINNATPSQALSVSGNQLLTGNLTVGSNASSTLISTAVNGGAIQFLGNSGTHSRYLALGAVDNSNNFYPTITVLDGAVSGGGNVGISSSTPTSQLTVGMASTTNALWLGVAGSSSPAFAVLSANNSGEIVIGTT